MNQAQDPTHFYSNTDSTPLPIFFPDATKAFVRAVDSQDVLQTKTPGVLVNTYHLHRDLTDQTLTQFKSIKDFMGWSGPTISDSGGFQIMSLARKMDKKAVTDEGVEFIDHQPDGSKQKIFFTPEKSIQSQLRLKTDLLVVLDDFTPREADYEKAEETVQRTIKWARRSKVEFERLCQKNNLSSKEKPYLIGVVQGGKYQDLRKKCAQELIKIGFDGLGFGGWPVKENGEFDYESAQTIANQAPDNYLLYGLGIGKPEDIVGCVKLGFHIFDCVLPTRDARHGRLYVFNDELDRLDLNQPDFYHYYNPIKQKHATDNRPISQNCDCHLCQNYSRAYLRHLFKNKETTALRLATIHNLRFYARLMEKLQFFFTRDILL